MDAGGLDWIARLEPWERIVLFIALAVVAHIAVRSLERAAERALIKHGENREDFFRRFPKVASILTIAVSSITFIVYFGAVGLILREFGLELEQYIVTATVVGLAVGFGLQGLVQDIVTGLTLIFSDVVDVGDVVEVSGQTGRIDRIGLRFTRLENFQQQEIFIPNRNMALIGRYRRELLQAYVDVQLVDGLPPERLEELAMDAAQALREQFSAAVVGGPERIGLQTAGTGAAGWRFLRIRFRLWPGQAAVIETAYRQRLLSALRKEVEDYPDWMISISLRTGE